MFFLDRTKEKIDQPHIYGQEISHAHQNFLQVSDEYV